MTTFPAVAVFAILCLQSGGGQTTQIPRFRAESVLVPIDVRVVDRYGKPVTDLTRDEFSVEEDGVPQTIRFFERQILTPAPVASDNVPLARAGPVAELRLQPRRVFLIMLGRLWLPSEVFGTADAVTRFIREALLPQDYVAVAAWGLATEFTTDHGQVAQVVERLRDYQQSVDRSRDRIAKIRNLYGYRGTRMPPETRAELEGVFQPGSLRARTAPHVQTLEVRNLLEQIEAHLNTLYQGNFRSSPSNIPRHVRDTMNSVTGKVLDIFSGVQYLRYIEGEKHLLYVSPGGLWLPGVEDDKGLAQIASDARVVIDLIQAGGLPGYDELGRRRPGPVNLEARMASKHISELTGGWAFFFQYPERALARIDVTTRSGYLLAYYPSNPSLDGRHRKLTVIVKRPKGATVLCRRSYIARDNAVPYDHRLFVAQDRILAAAEYEAEIDDIKVTLTAASVKDRIAAVQVRIDPTGLALSNVEGRRTASLDIAFFGFDGRGDVVGELWETIPLRLDEGAYQRGLEGGLRHSANVLMTRTPRYVKVVVYDDASDRVGSSVLRLR